MAYGRLARWMYRGGRPNALARFLNRIWAWIHALGIASDYLVTLEVVGRRSGRRIAFPLVMALVGDERYFVSMLGPDVAWVRNVRAADGYAVLRHGRTEQVRLVELPVAERPLVLRAYLRRAPGGRPHLPIDADAPLEAFETIASRYPVFRIVAAAAASEAP